MQFIEQKRSLKTASLCLLCCLFCCIKLFAQEDSSQVRQLKEVPVFGSKVYSGLSPVQTLQGGALQRLASQSVADAIRYFSGVQVKDYGGIGGLKTVDVRSMGTNHTGVFYNGVQVGNAQNGQVDLGRFSLDNMESVALVNGQLAQSLQTARDYATAASIYLQTKQPTFEAGRNSMLKGSFKTGSFGLMNPSLLYQRKLHSKLDASFNLEWVQATGRYKFRYRKKDGYDTTAYRKNGDVEALRAEMSLFAHVWKGEWNTHFYFYDAEKGLPGFIVNGVFGHVDRQWDRNFFVQSSFKKPVASRYSFMLNTKFASDYTRYLAPDTMILYLDNRYKQQEYYISFAQKFVLTSFWDINLSTDWVHQNMTANLVNFSYPTRDSYLAALSTTLHWDRFRLQGNILGTKTRERVEKNKPANPQDELTPALFVDWQPFSISPFKINAFYKRIFRMPTFNDLYYTEIGNAGLKPEFATQYNLGLRYALNFGTEAQHQVGIEVDGYYNEVSQKIVAMPTASQFRWTMMNLGHVEIRGIDVKAHATYNFESGLIGSARFSYTYQKAQDFTDKKDSFYGDQILYIPWHSGSCILSANYKRWDLNYSLIYTGERYNAKANIPENYVQPWYTSDFTFSKYMVLKRNKLRLTAQVNNIFNQYYDVVLNYPMPGRNYKFIISLQI